LVPIAVVGGVLGGFYGSGYFSNKTLKIRFGNRDFNGKYKINFSIKKISNNKT
jgi:hypothetical protein